MGCSLRTSTEDAELTTEHFNPLRGIDGMARPRSVKTSSDSTSKCVPGMIALIVTIIAIITGRVSDAVSTELGRDVTSKPLSGLKIWQEKLSLLKKFQNWPWIIWTFSVLYSLWKFKQASEKHFFQLNNHDFGHGWLIIGRPKDQTDFEWVVLKYAFKKFWPMLCFQIVITGILKRIKIALVLFYALYGVLCLTIMLGEQAAIVCLAFVGVAFLVQIAGKKSCCYFLCFCTLMIKNSSYISEILSIEDEKHNFLFDVAFTWIVAKCLSFMIDRINSHTHDSISLSDFSSVVGFCLYLPSVFSGPLISYDHFLEQVKRRNIPTLQSFTQKISHLLYILLWYLIFEIMQHFMYSSSIQFYPHVVKTFDSWSLCGLGYALPVMFYLKYFIIYSMAQKIASFENFELPPPPKCVSCIHLSSHLWRYLYHPLMQGKKSTTRKLCALAISFFFVCLWHNVDIAVCAWTFLNFLLVASETMATVLFSTEKIKKFIPRFARERWFHAVIGTPHFILMCISSTFFLANWDIGVILFNRIMFSGFLPLIPVCLIMFCGCRVSLDVRQMENTKQCYFKGFFQKS